MADFRTHKAKLPRPESPLSLFRDLKRDPSIKFPWDHQANLLSEYHATHLKTRDLALELPTGAGKTLVAMLIAEYRRRANEERVVFLCPTRQLCGQVARQASNYGVEVSLLVGRQREYDEAEFLRYQQAKSVAVTTYSGLFNINPRISDPQLIICDDAHAADNYVSELWTVEINRHEHKPAFEGLYQQLKSALPQKVVHCIECYGSNPSYARHVDLASAIAVHDHYPAIRELLEGLADDESWAYAWRMVAGHLDACAFYCSGSRFEIRPVIAPTLTHRPFADATQRIYMSATLGEDGDIERCFGVRNIKRLPIPKGWDKRGTGRRLVLFPGYGSKPDAAWDATINAFKLADRSLVLVPDGRTRERVVERLKGTFPILDATSVEQSMHGFTEHEGHPVLVIANRWEGIDLPGDDCRMMALAGMPTGAGLQERYLLDSLGAISQLIDRIRTRVTQAMGRCTRDEADYAVVLMLGSGLIKWCSTKGNLAAVHPELQAEIKFGLDNSQDRTGDDIVDLCQKFLTRSPAWEDAEADIVERRENSERCSDPVATALAAVVGHEIGHVYRLWNGDYEDALNQAVKVIEGLAGGKELRPYQSFWHHQAAIAAYLAYKTNGESAYRAVAAERLQDASKTSMGMHWLQQLRAKLLNEELPGAPTAVSIPDWFSQLNVVLTEWHLKGAKFARRVADLQAQIEATDASAFEVALNTLGWMLGAAPYRWSEPGAPDALWVFGDVAAVVFEAKTDERPGAISLAAVRQAATHEARVRADKLIPGYVPCITAIISNHFEIDKIAVPAAGEIRHVTQADIVKLFKSAADALGKVREFATGLADEEVREEAEKAYRASGIFVDDVVALLKGTLLRSLPVRA